MAASRAWTSAASSRCPTRTTAWQAIVARAASTARSAAALAPSSASSAATARTRAPASRPRSRRGTVRSRNVPSPNGSPSRPAVASASACSARSAASAGDRRRREGGGGPRPDGGDDQLVDGGGTSKAHLELGRMDVDVHFAGRDRDEQDGDRVAPAEEERLVAVEHGPQEEPVADPSPPALLADRHVGPDESGRARRLARRGEEPGQPVAARQRFHAHAVAHALAAEDLHEPLLRLTDRRQSEHLAAVVLESEPDPGTRDGEPGDHVDRVADLGRRRAQELPARRRLGEKLAHLDGR